jgi:hypothetical protein
LHASLRSVAKKDNVSINQLINSAIAEKVSALMTEDYLETRAARGSRLLFEQAMAQVPAVEPAEYDRPPSDSSAI